MRTIVIFLTLLLAACGGTEPPKGTDMAWTEVAIDDFTGGENPLGVMSQIAPNQLIVAKNVMINTSGQLSSLPTIAAMFTGTGNLVDGSVYFSYLSATSVTVFGLMGSGALAGHLVYKNFNPTSVTLPINFSTFTDLGAVNIGTNDGSLYWTRLGIYLYFCARDESTKYYRVLADSPYTLTNYTPPNYLNSLVAYGSRLWGTDGKKIYFSDLNDGTTFNVLSVIEPTLDAGDTILRLIPGNGILWISTKLGMIPMYGTSSADIRIPAKYSDYVGSVTAFPQVYSDDVYISWDGLHEVTTGKLMTPYHTKVYADWYSSVGTSDQSSITYVNKRQYCITGANSGSNKYAIRYDHLHNATFSQSNFGQGHVAFNGYQGWDYIYNGLDYSGANSNTYVVYNNTFGTVPITIQTRHENFSNDNIKTLRAIVLDLAEACNAVTVSLDVDRSGSFTTIANAQNLVAGDNVIYIPNSVGKTFSVKITTSNKFVLNKLKAKFYTMQRSI